MGHLRGSLKHLSMDWSRGYFSALKKAPTASQILFPRKCKRRSLEAQASTEVVGTYMG